MEKKLSKVTALLVVTLLYFLGLHVWFAVSAWPNDTPALAFTLLYAAAIIGSFKERAWGIYLAGILGGTRILLLAYSGMEWYGTLELELVLYTIIQYSILPAALVVLAATRIKQKGHLNNSTTKDIEAKKIIQSGP
ncbi:MAG: hypothetical protein ABH834_04205 [Candidatus Altiarchaeota archaeon]